MKGKNNKKKHASSQHDQVPDDQLFIEVEIDLSLSAYANASNMYNRRKGAQAKEQKTVENTLKDLANIQTTLQQLETSLTQLYTTLQTLTYSQRVSQGSTQLYNKHNITKNIQN